MPSASAAGGDKFADGLSGNGHLGGIEEDAFLLDDFLDDRHDSADAVDVFDMIVAGRRDFADMGRALADLVDFGKVELDSCFAGDCERVQNGVGASPHRHVESQRIMESVGVCDVARERSVFFRHLDDAFCGGFPEFPAVMAGGDDGAVAGQGEPRALRRGSSWSSP